MWSLFFWTPAIRVAHALLRELDVDIVVGSQTIGSATTVVFRDSDRKLVTVCQRNA